MLLVCVLIGLNDFHIATYQNAARVEASIMALEPEPEPELSPLDFEKTIPMYAKCELTLECICSVELRRHPTPICCQKGPILCLL